MKAPIFIRSLTEDERAAIQAGLRSKDAFVLRRCQILSASSRKERAPAIAHALGCDDQTVRNVIKGFNANGLAVLQAGSCRPHRLRTKLLVEDGERLRDLLHHSPREFGKPCDLWSLELVALVCFEVGLTCELISDESVRRAFKRLGINWKRAKHWITSPDPMYLQKKRLVIG
jgi:transposase